MKTIPVLGGAGLRVREIGWPVWRPTPVQPIA
jgi:hypothetical protein